MYKLILNAEGQVSDTSIFHTEKKCYIPTDPDNTDYQQYLEWTKASPMNVAAPADEEAE